MTPTSQHRVAVRLRRAWPVFALLALAGQASCSTLTGEGADSCEGELDGDGDSLFGCDDPDCHRFEVCRYQGGALVPDGGSEAGSGGGGSGGSAGATPTGGTGGGGSGGSGGSPMMSGGSGGDGGSGGRDSGVDRDASTCACEADEVCTDAGCVPMTDPEPVYSVQLISAESPRGLPGPPPDGVCIEIACEEGGGSPVSYCPCEPSPYVRVIHITNPTALDPVERTVLTTATQGPTLMLDFGSDEQVELDLQPGDQLRFELWDVNSTVDDGMIYACEPELNDLTPGPLECSARSGASGLEEFFIRAELVRR